MGSRGKRHVSCTFAFFWEGLGSYSNIHSDENTCSDSELLPELQIQTGFTRHLQQRENDLAKKKKKEEKEAKKGKRKYKDILNEHKRQKKSQKQLEADKSRRQQQKAKRQRVDKNSESSPANVSGSTQPLRLESP